MSTSSYVPETRAILRGRGRAVVCLVAMCALGSGSSPPGPVVDFATSFEVGEPQPTWMNTVDTDAGGTPRTAGVSGSLAGSIMDRVSAVVANGENPPHETAVRIADGEPTTKWLVFASTGWVRVALDTPAAVQRYAVTSANDFPARDPRDWVLEGSDDGAAWTKLDQQTGEAFAERFETHEFEIDNETPYTHYRLSVTANHGAGILQIAELELFEDHDTPPKQVPMRSATGAGPAGSWNARFRAGYTGARALRYAGNIVAAGRAYSYNKIFDVHIPVTESTELSYFIMPDRVTRELSYASTYAAIDLVFADGTSLSDLGAVDQNYAPLTAPGQGASRTLYAREWNYRAARIGDVAAGKTIDRIVIAYDHPAGAPDRFGGWIDDLRITRPPSPTPRARLSDYVLTTRGTNSSGAYSRGNTFPATAVPHGFNLWTPVTNARSTSWLYEYHRSNNADNLPTLQALSLSHEPSPWMGDRHTFQVMPSAAPGTPAAGRSARALAFRHDHEIARAHYYSVTFETGLRAEIAPTDHAAVFRFTFPGDHASLIFDNVNNDGGLTLDVAAGVVTGYSDVRSGLSAGATRMFIYAVFDRPVTAGGTLLGGGGPNVTGYLRFDAGAERTVTMRIATSLISVDQARNNLALEIADTDTFDDVKQRAQALWDDKLRVIEVEGATEDQRITLYSNLYRLFLYPNSGFENTGTAQAPVYQYASPLSPPTGPHTPTRTDAPIVTGTIYVNNGFWDTYRSAWPAYALLTPTMAGAMIDGFVQQYNDGGWVSRWSSPGYADLMTGTSSDVAFADAYLKGVRFDAEAAYDAALKNATVAPPNRAVGRKGLKTSIFRGYTSTETGAGLSWAMAGYLNDFGIANMAAALAEEDDDDDEGDDDDEEDDDDGNPRRREYLESAEYFRDRSLGYVHLFDPSVRFFQGRHPDGTWRLPANAYDPAVWGYDYTETNGWNMAFDAPHDGQGLANLYGGRDALADKLDAFFAAPETGTLGGSYGGVIHEMREARDVRMGQLGLSNQPAYHIIYMYNYAGRPWRAQAAVRDALARLFVGSTLGQGYLGDEDNGALSSWHVFSALGFYPLQVGSPRYAIGSPLFKKATVHLENGNTLVIDAPNNSPDNVYIQGLTVNGRPYTKTYLPHDLLTTGATLAFDMGPTPSEWGTAPDDAPPSITTGTVAPRPLQDTTGGGTATACDDTDVAALFDDTSATQVTVPAVLDYRLADGATKVVFYTLTSGESGTAPSGWRLLGSTNGSTWTAIDKRRGESFRWQRQTRAFKVADPGAYAHYRLEITSGAPTTLAEVELLARP